jgi:DNA replication protein DnaC
MSLVDDAHFFALLQERSKNLGFYAVVANWQKYESENWLEELLDVEAKELDRRSLERRIRKAKIGQHKPMTNFDFWFELPNGNDGAI